MTTLIMRSKDIRPAPSAIEYKGLKFLITDRPSDYNISTFIQELKRHRVAAVVRVCEPSYKVDQLEDQNITVHDLKFEDGTAPPPEIVNEWFQLLKRHWRERPDQFIAVHCVSGLGRAPVLVAIALMELGMRYEEAVELIREKRRGAINSKQLSYLERYRPKSRLKFRNNRSACCVQ